MYNIEIEFFIILGFEQFRPLKKDYLKFRALKSLSPSKKFKTKTKINIRDKVKG